MGSPNSLWILLIRAQNEFGEIWMGSSNSFWILLINSLAIKHVLT